MSSATVTDYYPEIEAFEKSYLKVSDIHELYYEQAGNKNGKPIIYLHGGPGGGISPTDRRYFDPKIYRIVLVDQRGSGLSKPPAELKDNTTWHLVEDIEKLRIHLKIDKWVVFGGSWGSTLSLTYAISHPTRVKALILRGIFTLRRKEVQWYYQDGANKIFPDHFSKFIAPIPEVERGDLVGAFYRRLTGDDEKVRTECAKRWSEWEMATSRLILDPKLLERADSDEWCLQFARIESHYFINGGFYPYPDYIFKNVDKIRHIPCTIVQGRYDVVCPMETAWELHQRLPDAEWRVVDDCGHSAKEVGIRSALVQSADKYKQL